MRFMIRPWSVRLGCVLLTALLLAGCAAGRGEFNTGEKAMKQGDYDLAVASLSAASEKAPDNHSYRLRLNTARYEASQAHMDRGDNYFAQGNYAQAQAEYGLAADLNGSNFAATDGRDRARKYQRVQKLVADAVAFQKARRPIQAKRALGEALDLVSDFQPALQLKKTLEQTARTVIDGVELEVNSSQLITLNFSDTKLPDVFEILTKLSGINFILDEDVRSDKTTLFLEQATFSQALELLLRMNKLDKKILNSKTIVLFPKTRDKQKQFEDQLIHTFYLSNIDAKKAVNLLRTMLQVRKIYVHEELNAVIIRDTPGVIKLAAKILEANDRGDAEVVFDLELIEVRHSDGLRIGAKLSANQVEVGIAPDATTSTIGSVVLRSFNGLDSLYGIPSAAFDFLKESGEGEVLANPKIRVKNKEKAKVHIGTREPVVTVTINDTQTSENVQYVDVGVKLDVEPDIQLDNTVVTKLGLEVSNVSERATTKNDTSVLTISTTNANTSLTLKDGETTVIGGLLRDSETKSKSSVPILGDIPLLGALFTSYDKSASKSEILLSITPHIVRSVSLPEHDVASIWSGGEDDLKFGRNFGTFADEYLEEQKGLEPVADDQSVAEEQTEKVVEPQLIKSGQLLPELIEKAQPSAVVAPPVEAPEEKEQSVATEKLVANVPVAEVEISEPGQPVNVEQALVYIKGSELVKVTEPFSLVFYVDEIKDLFSAPLYVQYDAELFEFLGATEGSFLKLAGSPTVFTHTAQQESGRIIVGLKQGAGGKGVSGGGELFIMDFKAKKSGTGLVEATRTNFRNPKGVHLQVDSVGLQVEVQ